MLGTSILRKLEEHRHKMVSEDKGNQAVGLYR